MAVTKQTLHGLIDIADKRKYQEILMFLLNCVPEEKPTPEEIAAIKEGRAEIRRGEFVRHEDIDWG